jgi:hypothetical protein
MKVQGRLREKVLALLFFPLWYLMDIFGQWYNSKVYFGSKFNFKKTSKETFDDLIYILKKKRV